MSADPRPPGCRATIETDRPEIVVLKLEGDLDLDAAGELESVLQAVLDRQPGQVFVDAAEADFMSVRTMTSIGRLSLGVDSVILVTPNRLAATVLGTFGFGDILCVDMSHFGDSRPRFVSTAPHKRRKANAG